MSLRFIFVSVAPVLLVVFLSRRNIFSRNISISSQFCQQKVHSKLSV